MLLKAEYNFFIKTNKIFLKLWKIKLTGNGSKTMTELDDAYAT